jgi:hypothetical protein
LRAKAALNAGLLATVSPRALNKGPVKGSFAIQAGHKPQRGKIGPIKGAKQTGHGFGGQGNGVSSTHASMLA